MQVGRRDGVLLRGMGMGATTLVFGAQTAATAAARRHLGLVHGANTTGGWGLEDLAIVAPQADHLSQYSGSPTPEWQSDHPCTDHRAASAHALEAGAMKYYHSASCAAIKKQAHEAEW